MIAATLFATFARLLGPDLAEVHLAVAADLPLRPGCELALELQPYYCPERVRWALTAIADRECPGSFSDRFRFVGRHRRDSVHDRGLFRAGHRRGADGRRKAALHAWCPFHLDPIGMSTVGPHGLIYLFNVHRSRVPGNCVPWWIFATNQVSALAARDRYLELCDEHDRSGWCPSTSAILSARRHRN